MVFVQLLCVIINVEILFQLKCFKFYWFGIEYLILIVVYVLYKNFNKVNMKSLKDK